MLYQLKYDKTTGGSLTFVSLTSQLGDPVSIDKPPYLSQSILLKADHQIKAITLVHCFSHEELLELNGMYHSMWTDQQRKRDMKSSKNSTEDSNEELDSGNQSAES